MSKEVRTGGMGFLGWLTILFITLKLIPYQAGHIINWSWWLVLLPMWGVLAFVLVLVLVVFVSVLIAELVKRK